MRIWIACLLAGLVACGSTEPTRTISSFELATIDGKPLPHTRADSLLVIWGRIVSDGGTEVSVGRIEGRHPSLLQGVYPELLLRYGQFALAPLRAPEPMISAWRDEMTLV
jgi:hypothetical protein